MSTNRRNLSAATHGGPSTENMGLTHRTPVPFGPLPSAAQLAWQRMETNLFVHFGMNTFTDREWGDGSESPERFNPPALDCRQWARAARTGGFKTVILTAKHHDGFCLWPTKTTAHSVRSSPWRGGEGDVVREFVDAMRGEGLGVGIYLSPWDRNAPCYGDSPAYNDFYCEQLTELLTGYGPLVEVWFDGACAEGPNGRRQEYDWARFFGLVKRLQPGAVTFGDGGTDVRWVGNERGYAGETCWATIDPRRCRFPGDSGIDTGVDALAKGSLRELLATGEPPSADGAPRVWRPAECDVSIRPGWFYHALEDSAVRTVENLVDLYLQSVGRNSLLLLNVPPTPHGLFHEIDTSRLAEFRTARETLFARETSAAARCREIARDDAVGAAQWEMRWPEPVAAAGLVDLAEPIERGQRVTAWSIEVASAKPCDDRWREIARGTTIGCRRLVRLRASDERWWAARLTIQGLAPADTVQWRFFRPGH